MERKKFQKGFVPIILIIFIVLIGIVGLFLFKPGVKENLGIYPACPKDLTGILTYPLIDLKGVAAIWPLGNISPPGHTSPADHNYFGGVSGEKVAVYAPADGWITNITSILAKDEKTGKYNARGITIDIDICKGLTLTFANLTEASGILKDGWPKNDNGCKYDIVKPGHTYTEGQCYYHSNIKVKAGDLLGYTQSDQTQPGNTFLGFEIWAANYNKAPDANVDWDYYQDDRRAHIMCTFDLYSGDLKNQFYAKLGGIDQKTGKFTPRTIVPLCGQVNQDVAGTIQGMWFSGKPKEKNDSVEFRNGGLAFIHNNYDGITGEISIGGDLNDGKATIGFFNPVHFGLINREPSEVKADGNIYCYNAGSGDFQGKLFLVQLIDNNHVKAEIQNGTCGSVYSFTKPFNYER